MDMLTAALYIILAFIVIQLLRLAFADGDLGLMWAERFGLKPGEDNCRLFLFIRLFHSVLRSICLS